MRLGLATPPGDRSVWVKVCGVSQPEEIAVLAAQGVHFGGLCVGLSGRAYDLSVDRAAELAALFPPSVRSILVTTDRDPDKVLEMIARIRPAGVQLAGWMSGPRIREVRDSVDPRLILLPVVHVSRDALMAPTLFPQILEADIDGISFDASSARGATDSTDTGLGERILPTLADLAQGLPFFVAGGIGVDTVAHTLARSGAAGIDVCSAVRGARGIEASRVQGLMDVVKGISWRRV